MICKNFFDMNNAPRVYPISISDAPVWEVWEVLPGETLGLEYAFAKVAAFHEEAFGEGFCLRQDPEELLRRLVLPAGFVHGGGRTGDVGLPARPGKTA